MAPNDDLTTPTSTVVLSMTPQSNPYEAFKWSMTALGAVVDALGIEGRLTLPEPTLEAIQSPEPPIATLRLARDEAAALRDDGKGCFVYATVPMTQEGVFYLGALAGLLQAETVTDAGVHEAAVLQAWAMLDLLSDIRGVATEHAMKTPTRPAKRSAPRGHRARRSRR